MRLHNVIPLAVLVLGTVSGDTVAQSQDVVRTNAKGNRALNAGKYETALKEYTRTLEMAEQSGDSQYRAIAMYGLARAHAQLCHAALAEQWFRDSISVRESIPDERGVALLTQNWIEFARFLLSKGRTDDAIIYFALAVPNLEGMGIEQTDPIGYAELLDTYVQAQLEGSTASSQVLKVVELRDSDDRQFVGLVITAKAPLAVSMTPYRLSKEQARELSALLATAAK